LIGPVVFGGEPLCLCKVTCSSCFICLAFLCRCLSVCLSVSRKYLYARCFTPAQLPCYLLWTDGQSNGPSKLNVCFCELRFVIRKPSIQELKVTFFLQLPPPNSPLNKFPQFTHRAG
jgi:hypothetical protein